MVEFETVWENPPQNRQNFSEMVPDGVDLAIFPELTFSGFTPVPVVDPDAETFLRELAVERATALIAGYVAPDRAANRPRNRAVAIDASGSVLARYDKLHPFTYAGEDRH